MVLGGALGPGLGARDARDAAPLLRGRRGTILHPRSFCVAGVERNDRCSVIHSALVTLAQRGKRRPKQTLQRIVLPPLQPQLQLVSEVFAENISSMHTTQPQLQRVSQVKLVICMQRCGPSGMFLLSACFGMFDFGMFKYFLLSACCVLRHV